jgi:hypothetical protein
MYTNKGTSPENEASTCDLYLAACLVTTNIRYHNTSVLHGRVYFHFDNEDGAVDRVKRGYLSRSLQVDALTYSDNVKSLKSFCAEMLKRR